MPVLVARISIAAVPVLPGYQLTGEKFGVIELYSRIDAPDDDIGTSRRISVDVVFIRVQFRSERCNRAP